MNRDLDRDGMKRERLIQVQTLSIEFRFCINLVPYNLHMISTLIILILIEQYVININGNLFKISGLIVAEHICSKHMIISF